MSDIDERIRQLAHELWLQDGMPEGKEAEHWFRASEIVRREIFEETVSSPNSAIEAEDFAGMVNPDPAARQSDEPVDQRAEEDRGTVLAKRRDKARSRRKASLEAPSAVPPTLKAPGPWHGLLS